MNRDQDASDGSNMATRPAISLMRRVAPCCPLFRKPRLTVAIADSLAPTVEILDGRIRVDGRQKVMEIESARSFVTAGLATTLMLTVSAAAQESEILRRSERTPRFGFKTEQGKQVTPTSFGGKLLVLNFGKLPAHPVSRNCRR